MSIRVDILLLRCDRLRGRDSKAMAGKKIETKCEKLLKDTRHLSQHNNVVFLPWEKGWQGARESGTSD